MNGTNKRLKFKAYSLCVLLLLGCLFLPNVQAQNGRTAKSVQTAGSVRAVFSEVIYFRPGNCEWIEQREYPKTGRLLRCVREDTLTPIVITGWADATGTPELNARVSLRRALTVRNYLVSKGVAAGRISIEGRGVDTLAASYDEARRAEVRVQVRSAAGALPAGTDAATGETPPAVAVQETETVVSEQEQAKEQEHLKEQEQARQESAAAGKPVTETPLQEEVAATPPDTPPAAVVSPRSPNTRTAHHWYVGVELGMPLGVSTFTSFASAGKAGFEGGVLGGYRISPLLSVEAGVSLGRMRLGASECCADYWLGADGIRYLSPVAGMDSYSYRDIHSSVSVQQYALRLNVELLQIVRPDWDKRWSLTVSPVLSGIGTQATLKANGTNTTLVKRGSRFRFGAGAGVGGSYRVTGNLGIGLRSGVVWVSGGRFDGITPTDHKENMIWNNTVTLIRRFGSNK